MEEPRPDFSYIVSDNEQAAANALTRGDFVQAFLLIHALTESILRLFLRVPDTRNLTFAELIKKYRAYLEEQHCPIPTFVEELTQFNSRRNRVVHQLWRRGFSFTNSQTESAAREAVTMYGLFIEWLETFDPEITEVGFRYDDAAQQSGGGDAEDCAPINDPEKRISHHSPLPNGTNHGHSD